MSLPTSFFHNQIQLGGGQWLLLFGEDSDTYTHRLGSPIQGNNGLKWNDAQQSLYTMWDWTKPGSQSAYIQKIDKDGNVTRYFNVKRGSSSWESRTFSVRDDDFILAGSESAGTSYRVLTAPSGSNTVIVDDQTLGGYKYIFAEDILYDSSGNNRWFAGGYNNSSGGGWAAGGLVDASNLDTYSNWYENNDFITYGVMADKATDAYVFIGRAPLTHSGSMAFARFSPNMGGVISSYYCYPYSSGIGGDYLYGGDFYGGRRNCFNAVSNRPMYLVGMAHNGTSNVPQFVPTSAYSPENTSYGLQINGTTRSGRYHDAKYNDVKKNDTVIAAGYQYSGNTSTRTNFIDGIVTIYNVTYANTVAPSIKQNLAIRQFLNGNEQHIFLWAVELDDDGFIYVMGQYTSPVTGVSNKCFIAKLDPNKPFTGNAGGLDFVDITGISSLNGTSNGFATTTWSSGSASVGSYTSSIDSATTAGAGTLVEL